MAITTTPIVLPLSAGVDNSTIEVTNNKLNIKDLGVTTAKIVAGTDKQILTTNGSSVQWGDGAIKLLASITTASSQATLTTNVTTTGYKRLIIELVGSAVTPSGNSLKQLALNFNGDTGNNYADNSSTAGAGFYIENATYNNGTTVYFNAKFEINNLLASGGSYVVGNYQSHYTDGSTQNIFNNKYCFFKGTIPITSVQVINVGHTNFIDGTTLNIWGIS